MTATKYSLNLSPRYAANWGAWEVAREIICNALDAAPDDMKITPNGADELIVSTPTVPDLSELFIIGEGTKAAGGDTIGQFGEGLKLAALVATRSGGSLTLDLPDKRVIFSFEDVMGVQVLHAEIDSAPLHEYSGTNVPPLSVLEVDDKTQTYTATIRMTGICAAYAGRILEDRTEGPQPKYADGLTIYFKGVFVSIHRDDSLWNWNLDGLDINRDRSMVSSGDVAWEIGKWMESNLTDDMANKIVAADEVVENDGALSFNHGGLVAAKLPAAFKRLHGNNVCLKSENESCNRRAGAGGRNVVDVASIRLRRVLANNGIDSADSWIKPNNQQTAIDYAPYKAQIDRLRVLDKLIDAPLFKVCVFEPDDDKDFGFADRAERTIWLSKRLFTDGNLLELVRTYLHEAAHIMSMAEDCTRDFESSLDDINGRLAMHILGGSK